MTRPCGSKIVREFRVIDLNSDKRCIERKIYADLLKWKEDPDRKPMILLGCRQVGKTFIIKEFGDREYENTVYLNFADNPGDRLLSKAILMQTCSQTGSPSQKIYLQRAGHC